jgi:hypothetical protein
LIKTTEQIEEMSRKLSKAAVEDKTKKKYFAFLKKKWKSVEPEFGAEDENVFDIIKHQDKKHIKMKESMGLI